MKKQIKWILLLTVGCLVACSSETAEQSASEIKDHSVNEDFEAAAASSTIATQILNSPQEQDILSTSRQAMTQINASDVLAVEQQTASAASGTAESLPLPALPVMCEQYFRRSNQCFSSIDENSQRLLEMNRVAHEKIANEHPTEEACVALDRSFDRVARNLGCE